LFLYRHVLQVEEQAIDQVPRAKLPVRVPVVFSREEVAALVRHLEGTMWNWPVGMDVRSCRLRWIASEVVAIAFARIHAGRQPAFCLTLRQFWAWRR
jgi:hypothetical protein